MKKYIYVNFIVIYCLYPLCFPYCIQYGNVIIFLFPILEIFTAFLISQMVESFGFWFCLVQIYFTIADTPAELQNKLEKQS